MPKVHDILRLKRDVVFGGAVQTDWYYDNEKSKNVSENFVFHGPDFFGVTEDDVEFKSHKLMDTCTYSKLISDKLYDDEGNPILLTIAPYGTGKSHLAATLGKLFSTKKEDQLVNKILNNIKVADNTISEDIATKMDKPNLVIMLNGMNDFNLNYEILNSAKKVLKTFGYGDEMFSEFTKAYSVAQQFLERNYDVFEESFKKSAAKYDITGNDSKQYLLDNIYKDEVFEAVNEVYKEVTGNYIRWDEGISAAEVLGKLVERLCGDKGEFNKILILFDEFGRYIEYASEYPNRAGDAALQQIFEVIQDTNNNIILVAFIQSDLKTYMARVNKTSNITRYIGRYEAGEKIYLSSNLETIFANLIEKHDKEKFDYFIKGYFNKNKVLDKNRLLFDRLKDWTSQTENIGIWNNWDSFNKVILQGIYPFNPLTVWLLKHLSDWYQQRSALNFLMDTFGAAENSDIKELGDLPQILPIHIIRGDFFKELLLAETEGRQKSEYCSLYDKIYIKYKDKLNNVQVDVLAGILILKLGRFKTSDWNDLLLAMECVTNISSDSVEELLKDLEESYGMISYDEKNFTYDFIEDATGINDFKRFIRKKKSELQNITLDILLNTDIKTQIGLDNPIKTDFAVKNNIRTSEWQYEQELLTAASINKTFIENYIRDFKNRTSPDKMKGRLFYVYCNSNDGLEEVNRLIDLYNKYELDKYPVLFLLLDDVENELYDVLIEYNISKKFTEEEKMKFSKFITRFMNKIDENLLDKFSELTLKRLFISKNGIEKAELRPSKLCNEIFKKLYTEIIPFPFEGFNNKNISNAKKTYANVARNVMSHFSYQWIQTQNKDVKNRIDLVLINEVTGWGVVNKDYKLVYPSNQKVKAIFDDMDSFLEQSNEINLKSIYTKYIGIPYGLNDYSFSLLLSVYLAVKGIELKMSVAGTVLKNSDWASKYFNEKNLDFSLLNETSIIKVDLSEYLSRYQMICSKIEKNVDIDECPKLKSELDALEAEEDVPEEFKEKVEGCKIILNEGLRLHDRTNKFIAEMKGILSKGFEEEDYKYIVKVISQCEILSGVIEENSQYVYNKKHLKMFELLVDKAREFIEKNFENFIRKVKCNSTAQVSAFEKWMKALRENLRNIGYDEYASLTHNRLDDILGDLKKIKMIETVLNRVNSFLNNTNITEFSSQEDLLKWKDEASTLMSNLEENKVLHSAEKKSYKEKLEKKLADIQEKLDELVDSIIKIQDDALEINSIQNAKKVLSKIESLIAKKLRQIDKEDIEEIGSVIQNVLKDIEVVDELEKLTDKLENSKLLKNKYKEYDEIVSVDNIIDSYIDELRIRINNLNSVLEKNHLSFNIDEVDRWNSNQCLTWLNETAAIPYYINDHLISKCDMYRDRIEKRVNELNIDSIVSIFNSLDGVQKSKCIEVLQEMM
ncbi:hypothetical protein RBH29_11695 [Herbivorax sp. ANBcel31]|uniref:hypothetical protein n=1 Tax=Herbivorax sp. ANBcel31 TaxID=3069754 RepID=UPI0027AEC2FF|nr:hypothetical protein [Herbivorax sp. ANBcel31]MDQ2087088.1 hypothetical protein [Herbivorax sp. ANBcel31]